MKIKLNDTVKIDLEKLIESRMLIQANSGGGKSHTIRRIIEQAFPHVQIIVIDPEGEFGNMRSKFDFVYVGKGGDAPAEPRSAALLATRLLELKASAIIDLYEIPTQRKLFVKLFLESLVNAPKHLWHDVLVIVDEAHIFAPEKDQSEALGAVIDLASRGRKRGYCAILATQRAAKLNKDAAAECNNKLIGRASLDIDRKRSADELGFSDKAAVLSLRDLDPGEFYAFGPAISRQVEKITIGEISVKPAKRGAARKSVAAPSVKVKKILSQLKDLPQEAVAEALTMQQLRENLAEAAREIRALKKQPESLLINPKFVEEEVARAVAKQNELFNKFRKDVLGALLRSHGSIGAIMASVEGFEFVPKGVKKFAPGQSREIKAVPAPMGLFSNGGKIKPTPDSKPLQLIEHPEPGAKLPEGEKKVLIAIASDENGVTREQITLLSSYKRSTRDAYIQRLIAKDFAMQSGDVITITPEGVEALGSDYKPLPTGRELAQHYIDTLPDGERRIFEFVYNAREAVTRDQISEATTYQRSTRDAYIQRLQRRQLLKVSSYGIAASDHLYA